MLSLLPPPAELSLFLTAAFIMGISPGPGMMYVMARALGQGRNAALVSTLGLFLGSFLNCLAAALGLAALLAVSPNAFTAVRLLGAAYLLYLAFRVARQAMKVTDVAEVTNDPPWAIFRQAITTNILNPKAGMFYLAVVPPFTDPERGSVLLQFMLLGLVFNIFGNAMNLSISLFFGSMGDWLARHPNFFRMQRLFTATVMTGLALHLAIGL